MTINFTLNIHNNNYTLLTLHGTEALSKPFVFNLTFNAPLTLDDSQLLGQPALLSIKNDNEFIREIAGVIIQSSINQYLSGKEKQVCVTLSPSFSLLKAFIQQRVFLHQSITDITENILTQHAKYSSNQIKWHLKENDSDKPMTLQVYQESDFDFLQRLLAKAGIFYWFNTINQQEQIILTDQNIQLPSRKTHLVYQTAHGLKNSHSVYALTLHHHKVTDQFTMRDYNEDKPEMNLIAQSQVFTHKPVETTNDIYGIGVKTLEEAQQIANLYANCAQVESFEILAKSHCSDLFPGLMITLQTHHWFNGNYLITAVTHIFKNSFYYNTFKLIPHHIIYRSTIPDHPNIPFTWSAKIEGFDHQACLDDQGRYRIRYCFDESNTPTMQASPPIRRMLSYNGPSSDNDTDDNCVGTHFPLQHNTEILLSCLHGDPDRPFILASLPNADHLSPVNCNNPTQNRIVTRSGNKLMMEDHPEHQYIALYTYGRENELRMASNLNKQNISLSASKGNIHFHAQQNSRQITKANLEEIINTNRKHIIQHTHTTQTKTGNLHYQIKTNTQIKANKNCYLKSPQHIEMTSGNDIQLSSSNHTFIKTSELNLQSRNATLNISGKHITFSMKGTIHIHSNGAGIILQPNGTITLYGQSVNGNISFVGNVIKNPLPLPCPHSPLIPTINQNQRIQDLIPWTQGKIEKLFWSQTSCDVQDTVTAHFVVENFQCGNKGHIKIYAIQPDSKKEIFIDQVDFTIEQNEHFIQIQVPWQPVNALPPDSDTPKQFTFKTIPCDLKQLKAIHYHFEVEIEGVTSQKRSNALTLTTTVILELLYTNKQPLPHDSQITLIDNQYHTHIEHLTQNTITFSKIALGECWVQIQYPINNLSKKSHAKYYGAEVLDQDNALPYYGGILTLTHQTSTTHTYPITVLPPFLLCNIRENSDTWNSKEPIDSNTIEMIKQTGNKITLFIHGYHVPLGQCHEYYTKVNLSLISTLTGEFSDIYCTVYRKPSVLAQRFSQLQKINRHQVHHIEQMINGSFAHQWAIAMEDNLNRAAGFNYQNYENYTRMLHITWSGDHGKLNFIEAVKHTAKAGKRLAILLRYLKQHGIETINIISHSLGAEVLLFAMNELGNTHQTFIDHAFLWQAAVPNDALSDQPKYYPKTHHPLTQNDFEISNADINRTLWYDFPKAYLSTRHITVLYSHNDNVLGPIPDEKTQQKNGLNQTQINRAKPFLDEYLPAKILTDLGLHSCFELATWLKGNLIDLFTVEKQDEIYQNFLTMHKTEINKTTGQPFAKTLDEAINQHDQYRPQHKINFATWKQFQIHWLELLKQTNQDDSLHLKFKLESLINTSMLHVSIHRLVGLLNILLHDFGFHSKPAMGYSGVDDYTKHKLKDQLYLVPQHKWLLSHSGMKRPSQALMKNIYQKWIINKINGIKKFGRIE